ncbi:HPr kinase/phosphorylase [Sphingopyxis yananensis]|uniref:HPr kinase/phosphorylase n=1 Tax=Sphingopyxis yananensis TaxID=2886687 RepID=UPI001D0F7A0D|nr:HPr kinase/phosphatase C-terminal domain-containing protein [Sphingopyxis yananensis]MCC2602925.1 HPr kinase/phosphatase C-terminal domain-containing protein [Sphingopyxis yananensis]
MPDNPDTNIFHTPPLANIHASCVAMPAPSGAWLGILLLGPSGVGKSDLALRLIDRGAMLVADDRCDIWHDGDNLWASAPKILAGMLEVRGLGVLPHAFLPSVSLSLAVSLQSGYDRFPMDRMHSLVAGHPLPSMTLDPFEISAPIKVALALQHHASLGAQP